MSRAICQSWSRDPRDTDSRELYALLGALVPTVFYREHIESKNLRPNTIKPFLLELCQEHGDSLSSTTKAQLQLLGGLKGTLDLPSSFCSQVLLVDQFSYQSLDDVIVHYWVEWDSDISTKPYATQVFEKRPATVISSLITRGYFQGILPASAKDDVFSILQGLDANLNLLREPLSTKGEILKSLSHQRRQNVLSFFTAMQQLCQIIIHPTDLPAIMAVGFSTVEGVAYSPLVTFRTLVAQHGIDAQRAKKIHNEAKHLQAIMEQTATSLVLTTSSQTLSMHEPSMFFAASENTAGSEEEEEAVSSPDPFRLNNMSNWFGDLDDMGCPDCCSVTSPAAYFVDLLRFLKTTLASSKAHNNAILLPTPSGVQPPPPNSLLAKLFVRRPELGDLLLSCRNTSERVLYIDLVNEILESAVVYLDKKTDIGSGLVIDCHNADSYEDFGHDQFSESPSTSSNFEAPRDASNIKYGLYDRVISKAVFPSSVFPYDHSSDAVSSYLKASGISTLRLLEIFQPCSGSNDASDEHEREAVARAYAASSLNLSEGDFVALTEESFYSLDAIRIAKGKPDLSVEEYQKQAGLQPSWYYWGYQDNNVDEGDGAERMLQSEEDLDGDESDEQLGLTFIQKQLLPRLGESFATLVSLLKTRFMARLLVIVPSARSSSPLIHGHIATQLQDFRLYGADAGRLNTFALKRLEQILRLWRRCRQDEEYVKKDDKSVSWTLEDVDDALYAFGELPQTESSLSSESVPEDYKIITPKTIKEMAAITEIAKLGNTKPKRVLAIFEKSATFLRELPVTRAITIGQQGDTDILTMTSNYLPPLLASLELSPSDFVQIQADEQLSLDSSMTVHTIFLLYRLSALSKLLRVPYAKLSALLGILREKLGVADLSSPQSVLTLLRLWQGLTDDGWTPESIISFTDKAPCGIADISQAAHTFFSKALRSTMMMTAERFVYGGAGHSPGASQAVAAAANSLLPDLKPEMVDTLLNLLASTPAARRDFPGKTVSEVLSGVLEHAYVDDSADRDQVKNAFVFLTQDTTMTIHGTVTQGSQTPKSFQLGAGRVCHLTVRQEGRDGSATSSLPTRVEGKVTITGSQDDNSIAVLSIIWPNELHDVKLCFDGQSFTDMSQSSPVSGLPCVVSTSMMAVVQDEIDQLQKYSLLFQKYNIRKEEVQAIAPMILHPSGDGLELIRSLQRYVSIRKSIARPGMEIDLALLVHWFCTAEQGPNTRKETASRLSQATLLSESLAEKLLTSNVQRAVPRCSPVERLELLAMMAQQTNTLLALGLRHDALPLLFTITRLNLLDNSDDEQSTTLAGPRITLTNHLREALVARGAAQSLAVIQDNLRNKRRKALIQYLLQHRAMKARNILDEGDLFEFFLIDVQMSSGLETTRIQQAISTIQLFVHRCLFGGEAGVEAHLISQDRWSWMKRYSTWEANRRVFLYPETYADPTMRDSKTEIFRSVVEEAAMQNTLDDEVVRKIIRGYVYAADEVANLRIEAVYYDPEYFESKMSNQGQGVYHLFARTRNAPYAYFYRSMEHIKRGQSTPSSVWTSWRRMPIDITSHEADAEGKALERPGCYLVPIVWKKRLIVFMPKLVLQTSSDRKAAGQGTMATTGTTSTVHVNSLAKLSVDIKLAWTEQIESVFVAPRQSQVTLSVPSDTSGQPPAFESFWFEAVPSTDTVSVIVYQNQSPESINATASNVCLGEFILEGSSVSFRKSDKMSRVADMPNWTCLNTQFGSLTRSTPIPGDLSKLTVRPGDSKVHSADWPHLPLPGFGTEVSCKSMTWTMSSLSGKRTGIVVDAAMESSHGCQPWFLLCSTSDSVPLFNTIAGSLRNALANDHGVGELYRVMDKSGVSDQRKEKYPVVDHSLAFGNSPYLAQYREDATPCAIYNWETGFHNVSLLMERLMGLQQFEKAIDLAHLVFDPTGSDAETAQDDWRPVWRFPPFRDPATRTHGTVDSILKKLQASTGDEKTMDTRILAWRRSPFQPHAVARNRPLSYMKRFVMKYIEALVAAGDVLFRQNSLELVPLAIQRYIEALHVFGPRPQTVTELNQVKAFKSYNQLAERIDDFSNASVLINLSFPYYIPLKSRGQRTVDDKPSLEGFPQTTYFGIQANADFVKLRGLIDDRLFKIRNSLDINGNPRIISIWDPPINPSSLVKAVAAAGENAGAVLRGDTGLIMPTYDCQVLPRKRFTYLLSRALELCVELKASTANLLAAIEKKDGESLQMIRARQDSSLQRIIIEMKTHQKKEAELGLDQLEHSRRSHVHRLEYYAALTGDLGTIRAPKSDEDFCEIQQVIPQPQEEDLRLTNQEKLELKFADESSFYNDLAAQGEWWASMAFLLPMPCLNLQFMGLGISEQLPNIGQHEQIQASLKRAHATKSSEDASRASRIAQWTRQLQERRLQLNLAGLEVKNVDKQIEVQKTRIAVIETDIRSQQQNVESAAHIHEFLSKTQIRATLYQTYLISLELARKVEAVYLFERGPCNDIAGSHNPIIPAAGYWDSSHHGLHAGEQLWLSLKQLELAYMNKDENYPPFNISKNISLRQLNPAALLSFRELGDATFELPEFLFDLDFPGHYFRRIQSVAFSIHCVVGPYTTINCTATLVDHKYRSSASSLSAGYAEKADGCDERFIRDKIKLPISSVAISSGQHDSGVFDLAFNTDEYQPFEGAGVISTWRMRLPDVLRQFDYRSISDVVVHLRYTARDGGATLRKAAAAAAIATIKAAVPRMATLSMLVDIRQDAPDSWFSLSLPTSVSKVIPMRSVAERLPYYAKTAAGIQIKEVVIYAAGSEDVLKQTMFTIVAKQPNGSQEEVVLGYAEVFGTMCKFTVGAASVTEGAAGEGGLAVPNFNIIKSGQWSLKLEGTSDQSPTLNNPTDIVLLVDYMLL
ncbi:hypothetical protein F5Y03DRAFT_411206 [Xylaria venustula]|nr:hypothetical protein F5Y03DRAFT_411206 [Xylaria venustula]